jgi:DNA-binding XRE family transcriptional regulator
MSTKTKPHSGPVTRAEYVALLARIEDVEDAVRMQAAERRGTTGDAMPADLVRRMLAGEHPVRLWREQRCLTQSALAKRAGLPAGYLSDIESGKKAGSLAAYRKLAGALGVEIGDVIPNVDSGAC